MPAWATKIEAGECPSGCLEQTWAHLQVPEQAWLARMSPRQTHARRCAGHSQSSGGCAYWVGTCLEEQETTACYLRRRSHLPWSRTQRGCSSQRELCARY